MYLDSPRLADVAGVLGAAVERLQAAGGKVVLILDQPDVLLAAASLGDGVTGTAWKDVLLGLREVSYFSPFKASFPMCHSLGQRLGDAPSSGSRLYVGWSHGSSTLLCSLRLRLSQFSFLAPDTAN